MWKTGTGEFSFCEKPESENFFFLLSENSRFVENGNWRILVLWKIRIGEFFFFLFIPEFSSRRNGEFSFCGKRELENSRFAENQNRRIFFFSFFFLTRNSRFVENGN